MASRHEGVSCDSCSKNNFSGRRFKCLVCFDYDLCSECYEAGHTGSNHTIDHPMQCILTRSDYELYYGNESVSSEQPQALVCPFCRSLGFTESALHEHVVTDHPDQSFDVICPICAATPQGDPNRMTDDLGTHLAVDHLSRRDTTAEESVRHHRGRGVGRSGAGRAGTALRSRGRGAPLSSAVNLAIARFDREAAVASDPITELLSQLGGMRRANSNYASTLAQIQQLQQQLGRTSAAPRRAVVATLPRDSSGRERIYADALWEELASSARQSASTADSSGARLTIANPLAPSGSDLLTTEASQLLIPKLSQVQLSDEERVEEEQERRRQSLFVQELFLSTLDGDFSYPDSLRTPGPSRSSRPSAVANSAQVADDISLVSTQSSTTSESTNKRTRPKGGAKSRPPSNPIKAVHMTVGDMH